MWNAVKVEFMDWAGGRKKVFLDRGMAGRASDVVLDELFV